MGLEKIKTFVVVPLIKVFIKIVSAKTPPGMWCPVEIVTSYRFTPGWRFGVVQISN